MPSGGVAGRKLPGLTAQKDMYRRYLAPSVPVSHNAEMAVVTVFFDFLQRIAVGAGAVFAILVAIWLALPKRSRIDDTRRMTN